MRDLPYQPTAPSHRDLVWADAVVALLQERFKFKPGSAVRLMRAADVIAHAIAAGRAETGEACAKVVDAEEELPGNPPPKFWELEKRVGAVESHRATVRATKKSIARKIRSLSPSAAAPTPTPASGGRSPAALDLDRDIDKGPRACDPTEP